MFVDDYIKSEIKKHSISDAENECCGLVVFSSKDKVNIVFPCENKAKKKDSSQLYCQYAKAWNLDSCIERIVLRREKKVGIKHVEQM